MAGRLVDDAYLVAQHRRAILPAVAGLSGAGGDTQKQEDRVGFDLRGASNSRSLALAAAQCRLARATHVSYACRRTDGRLRGGDVLRPVAVQMEVGCPGDSLSIRRVAFPDHLVAERLSAPAGV